MSDDSDLPAIPLVKRIKRDSQEAGQKRVIRIPPPAILAEHATDSNKSPISPIRRLPRRSERADLPHTVIGLDSRTGEQISIDDASRCSGCYVIGTQGVGKSSLLESMIYQDIERNYPVIVLDPHGELIENIISRIAESHLHRTYFLDLTDEAYPFGFNIFSPGTSSREPTITKNRVMSIFEKVWPSETRGLLLPMLLQNVTETLIEHADTMTIADIPALLLDADYRAEKVAQLKSRRLKEYWQLEYDTNSASVQKRDTAPLRTRLNSWLADPVITNIICQKEATIDFRAAIDRREIILVKLPINQPGYEHAAPIIGTMILSQIYAATFSFADTSKHMRPGYSLYIDEFQKFASSDTAKLFTEGRKYKVRQTLAHQTRVQLRLPEVETATLSANTVIAFKTVLDDSRELAPQFTDIDLFPQIYIHRGDIYPHMKRHKHHAVSNFFAWYIRRWEEADGKEPKTRREDGYEYKEWPRWNLGHGLVEYHPNQVRTALNVVEALLYAVMQSREITEQVAQTLVEIESGNTIFSEWYTEGQVQQFSGSLRAAMTALLQDPIGEKQETDKPAVEEYLSHQDKRHALANISSITHAIKTLPLQSGVSPAETHKRIERIQEQTRETYCKPRSEVEAAYESTEPFAEDEDAPPDEEIEPGTHDERVQRQRFEEL